MAISKDIIEKDLNFLKSCTRYDQALARSISLQDGLGFLVPYSALSYSDKNIIQRSMLCISTSPSFPKAEKIEEKFLDWMRQEFLEDASKLLFVLKNKEGHDFALLGFEFSGNDCCKLIALQIDEETDNFHNYSKALATWLRTMFFINQLNIAELASLLPQALKQFSSMLKEEIEKNESFGDELPANRKILTAGPLISGREASYALDAAQNGWNDKWDFYLKRFESNFAEYLGVKHALAFSSCTGALHLALLAMDIGPGDEVIVPEITWVASANAIRYTGATPVFADVDKKSWCLDPASFESLITKNTKAVIPVHLYGHPAKMDEIVSIAKKHNLKILEDAAPAIGAEFNKQKVGTFGDGAAFSFQGAKLLVTGEGGMFVTNDSELFARIHLLWDQGREPGTFWIKSNGWKYKMSNAQAAIGLGQLERVDALIAAKRRVFSWYQSGLKQIEEIELNEEVDPARSIYWMSSILVSKDCKISSLSIREQLKTCRIDSRPVFPPISAYPIWGKEHIAKETARIIGQQAINLPSGVCLSKQEVDFVCKKITQIFSQK